MMGTKLKPQRKEAAGRQAFSGLCPEKRRKELIFDHASKTFRWVAPRER